MFTTKNLSLLPLSMGLLSLFLGSTYASAATNLTALFQVYEEACGSTIGEESELSADRYNNFKNSFIGHNETYIKGEYDGTRFFLRKNYIIPNEYRKAIDTVTITKGDKYNKNSITYTVKFKDASYRKIPLSHLNIYLVPNSGEFYDEIFLKSAFRELEPKFKHIEYNDDEWYGDAVVGADFNYKEKSIRCDAISGSYK